jgi:hypothetical protein
VTSPPLATAKFEQDPCSLLTKAQANDLGQLVDVKPDVDNPLGPGCQWNDTTGAGVGVTFARNADGLSGAYQQNRIAPFAYFIPVPSVAGYPGVFDDRNDDRAQGFCTLVVAIRDDQAFVVVVTLGPGPQAANSCQLAQKTAEYAIATMKAGA